MIFNPIASILNMIGHYLINGYFLCLEILIVKKLVFIWVFKNISYGKVMLNI